MLHHQADSVIDFMHSRKRQYLHIPRAPYGARSEEEHVLIMNEHKNVELKMRDAGIVTCTLYAPIEP